MIAFSAPVAAWEKAGQYFEHQGDQIFYRLSRHSSEHAPVLLLIHGFPTSSYDWRPIWSSLAEKYTLIACDMLGFGFSDKPSGDYCMLAQADIHQALLGELGYDDVHMMAHDYGVSIAQELLARQLPIRSVTWLNGGIFPEQHRPILTQKILNSPLGPFAAKLFNWKKFERGMSKVWGKNRSSAETELAAFWEILQYKDGTRLAHRLIRYIDDRKRHRDRWVTAVVSASEQIPMVLINGILDPVSGAHLADYFEEQCPRAACIRLQDVGHYPQVEAPEAVLKAFYASDCG